MSQIKFNYDKEADVLYIAFERSDHVTGVEIGDHLILRLDTGRATGQPPRAVGLTVLSPAHLLSIGHMPTVPLYWISRLKPDLRLAVLEVLSQPPLCDLLNPQLTLLPESPTLAELVAA